MGTFKDALKKWFYTENSSAASSDARVALMDANGDPKGSDTMGKMAQTLISQITDLTSGQNVDELKTVGKYRSASSQITNSLTGTLPSGLNTGFLIFVFEGTQKNIKTQILINYTGSFVCIRSFINTWSQWYKYIGV